jgi:hypothetical protein
MWTTASAACQVASLDGEVLVHEAFGDADSHRFLIFSATKPFVASLIWQLLGEGLPAPSSPCTCDPEFGSNGKDAVTSITSCNNSGFPKFPSGPRGSHEGGQACHLAPQSAVGSHTSTT